MGLSKSEMETYISFTADTKEAVIYTTDPVWIRKMKKLCDEQPDNYQIKEVGKVYGEEISITVICSDKKLIKLRSKRAEMSEEQKAKLAERFKKPRETDSELESLDSNRE